MYTKRPHLSATGSSLSEERAGWGVATSGTGALIPVIQRGALSFREMNTAGKKEGKKYLIPQTQRELVDQ